MFNFSDIKYTSLFCEENIWHLGQSLIFRPEFSQLKVMIISNTNKQVAIYQQKSVPENQAVIWDYHVILEATYQEELYIFDFDSRLPFPVLKSEYKYFSFPISIPEQYQSLFRIIPAEIYLQRLYSDRSHMKDIIEESKFPSYPAILSTDKEKFTLGELINFNKSIDNTQLYNDLDFSLAANI